MDPTPIQPRPLTLAWLNAAEPSAALDALDGVYEHSPWVVADALARRPFASLAGFKQALVAAVRAADRAQQVALLRAHPELAGKAAVAGTLTAESTNEQARAGLGHCSQAEFAQLQELNAAYNARLGWPFILAVRGPRGAGLTRAQIISTFARRVAAPPESEFAECLRNVHRIAELRLNEKFDAAPARGNAVWDWAESLAAHSEPGYAERGELTVTYLTAAHQACARDLQQWMRGCGCDEVGVDAVGNVVGVYFGSDEAAARTGTAPRLLTGSHYDTVRNAGKYDGRLGVLVPLACVRDLSQAGRRLPLAIEIVGFAEEEGQRYRATFLGSSALTGDFDAAWLDQRDADDVTMRAAMHSAGLPATLDAIGALRRDPANYLGFVEVHIEQGPVLNELDLPLGVVTSINGSRRFVGEVIGLASHAGTTPMNRRRDAAAAVAEFALYVETRAALVPDLVATIGQLIVPDGSVNVVPGRCQFSLDVRAPTDAVRDAMVDDMRAELAAICVRRGLAHRLEQTLIAAAAPSDPSWQRRWEHAVAATGVPVHRMPSGAGHDAMKLATIMPQAMLFIRGEHGGISHNRLESSTTDDIELAIVAFGHLLDQLAAERPETNK